MATAASLEARLAGAAENPALRLARWIALLLPASLLAGAIGSEVLGGLVPCEMCHWQRWPHYAAVPIAALSFATPGQALSRGLVWLAAAAIAVSWAIGVYHAGVELGIFEVLNACTDISSGKCANE